MCGNIKGLPLPEKSKTAEFLEAEHRTVDVQGSEVGEMGKHWSKDTRFQL